MAQKRYFESFPVIEIQQTFYQIPNLALLRRWRAAAPRGFEFTIKAFQGISHSIGSPTWRRYKGELAGKPGNYGRLQPTAEVFRSWQHSLSAARALGAQIILIQLPASFRETAENIKNAESFFARARGARIALELRGWSDKSFTALCKRFDLIQVVDPFITMPGYVRDIVYLRLHGSYRAGRINYRHRYTARELAELRQKIRSLREDVYVMFNNAYMAHSAKQFISLMHE